MSETPTEQPTATPEAEQQAPKPTLADSLATLDEDTRKFVLGEVEKARSEAKGLRTRVKDLEPKAQQLETLQQAQQTAEERAQQQAQEAQDRAATAMQKAARTTLKTALSGVVEDPESVIDDLNIAKFVTDDGEIDEDAVTALRDRYAALGGNKPRTPAPNPAQGAGGNRTPDPRAEFAALWASSTT